MHDNWHTLTDPACEQEWMLEQSTALQRPAAPAEDAGEEAPPAPSCPTFRLLDEALPSLYLPNVSYARTIVFFKCALLALHVCTLC